MCCDRQRSHELYLWISWPLEVSVMIVMSLQYLFCGLAHRSLAPHAEHSQLLSHISLATQAPAAEFLWHLNMPQKLAIKSALLSTFTPGLSSYWDLCLHKKGDIFKNQNSLISDLPIVTDTIVGNPERPRRGLAITLVKSLQWSNILLRQLCFTNDAGRIPSLAFTEQE